jgi:hypothetical protein
MKHRLLLFGIAAMTLVGFGCAITDYDGHADHQTASEAKLWGTEIAFTGTGDPNLDGTYSYTAKYDNRGGRDSNMRIITYRNPVPSSFSRDGQIDRDGDDIQGRTGILGGKFLPQWLAVDPLPGCQFFDNVQPNFNSPAPGIALCDTVEEEVDKDLDLQASFGSTGDLLAQVWSGALNDGFTMELTGITLGGVNVPLSAPLSIGARANGIRPMQFSIDLSQPGGAALVQAILANTANRVPISVGLSFAGGMSLNLPSHHTVAFNHDALWNVL